MTVLTTDHIHSLQLNNDEHVPVYRRRQLRIGAFSYTFGFQEELDVGEWRVVGNVSMDVVY